MCPVCGKMEEGRDIECMDEVKVKQWVNVRLTKFLMYK